MKNDNVKVKGLGSAWKDADKKHRQICFGYAKKKNLFIVEATIGKKNPVTRTMALTPRAAKELYNLMTEVFYNFKKL